MGFVGREAELDALRDGGSTRLTGQPWSGDGDGWGRPR